MAQDKRIMTVLMQWEYGNPAWGKSCTNVWFYQNLKAQVPNTEPFWFDDYKDDQDKLQQAVLDKANAFKPDMIFVIPSHNQIHQATFDQLKKEYMTVGWFGDDHWRFEGFSANYAPHFTHVITTDPWAVPKYQKIGINPILTEWAAQLFSEPQAPFEDDAQYKYDVSFVGGANPVRKWFIAQLQKTGINIECFGAGWPNGRISYEEMEQIFRLSRINLNLSNSANFDFRFMTSSPRNFLSAFRIPKRVEQIKARNFEIPMAGGFQLTNYVPGIERHFDIGKEIVGYTNLDDCEKLINYYLNNQDERYAIANQGYQRAISDHTFSQRIQDLLNIFWNE